MDSFESFNSLPKSLKHKMKGKAAAPMQENLTEQLEWLNEFHRDPKLGLAAGFTLSSPQNSSMPKKYSFLSQQQLSKYPTTPFSALSTGAPSRSAYSYSTPKGNFTSSNNVTSTSPESAPLIDLTDQAYVNQVTTLFKSGVSSPYSPSPAHAQKTNSSPNSNSFDDELDDVLGEINIDDVVSTDPPAPHIFDSLCSLQPSLCNLSFSLDCELLLTCQNSRFLVIMKRRRAHKAVVKEVEQVNLSHRSIHPKTVTTRKAIWRLKSRKKMSLSSLYHAESHFLLLSPLT